jgi:hypothetical protein
MEINLFNHILDIPFRDTIQRLVAMETGVPGENRRPVVQSVTITTNLVVNSNTAHGEVYSLQHYVINFASDFRQVAKWTIIFNLNSLSKNKTRYMLIEI